MIIPPFKGVVGRSRSLREGAGSKGHKLSGGGTRPSWPPACCDRPPTLRCATRKGESNPIPFTAVRRWAGPIRGTVPAMPARRWVAPASRVQDSNLLLPFTRRLLFRDELARRVAEGGGLEPPRRDPAASFRDWCRTDPARPPEWEEKDSNLRSLRLPGYGRAPLSAWVSSRSWFQPGSNRRLRVEGAGSFR